MQVARIQTTSGEERLVVLLDDGSPARLEGVSTLAELLRLPLSEIRAAVDRAQPGGEVAKRLLRPIDGETEVWAAGVTYKRSEEARVEESATPDIYSKVYRAERPELFFKANARRVSGPDEPVTVRSDSTWDVPEPELALVVNTFAEIVGYAIGNDVSSRSIEGENPLYLPQAKVYARCFSVGPAITPAWSISDPYALGIRMRILRGGALHWSGETSMREFARKLEDLVRYLFLEDDFPDGVILSTGTALVPDSPFTLEAGDVVEIEVDGLGTLRNPVVRGRR